MHKICTKMILGIDIMLDLLLSHLLRMNVTVELTSMGNCFIKSTKSDDDDDDDEGGYSKASYAKEFYASFLHFHINCLNFRIINRNNREVIKTNRKFHIALLLVLCLCYNMSIALGNDMNEKNPSFDMATSKIREPKDVVLSPARVHELALHDEDYEEDEEDENYDDDGELIRSKSANGTYIGAKCETTCSVHLHNVRCDSMTHTCGCDKEYPVILGLRKGCAKPKKLGEQCLYHQTCAHNDPNSLCVQVRHIAKCECADGYHSVSFLKPTKRIFCTEDLEVITSKLPTLLGVITSIAVLGGLICMVLYLFSKNKYPRPRDYGDTHLAPPIMYASDTARPSSRSSQRSSDSISSYNNRRASGVPYHSGSKGVLVSTSRTGSRRPSLASVHSTSSSIKSYSMKRFEQELQQKELRQEMKKQLTKLQEQQQLQRAKPCIIIGDTIPFTVTRTILPTPSPITPKSTDELLPSVCEEQEFSPSLSNNSERSNGSLIGVNDRPSTSHLSNDLLF